MTEKDLLRKLLSTATLSKNVKNETVLIINSIVNEKDIGELEIYKELINSNPIKFVDLGLSVLWADRNVGADSETDYGDYFNHFEAIDKLADNSFWRMPTKEELKELMSLPSEWVENYKNSGHNGRVFTGNGNSIFVPAAGYWDFGDGLGGISSHCCLWSSLLYSNNPGYAWDLNFGPGYVNMCYDNRYYGFTIRGVCLK